MQYGLSLPNGGFWSEGRRLAELAYIAEESGWDGVFLEDYIVWQSDQTVPTHDPWIALAAIALRTDHIRIGTHRSHRWHVAGHGSWLAKPSHWIISQTGDSSLGLV